MMPPTELKDDKSMTKSYHECAGDGSLRCYLCTAARSCPPECQIKGWKKHKLFCANKDSDINSPVCGDAMKASRALHFDPNGTISWTWVPYYDEYLGYKRVGIGSSLAVTAEEKSSRKIQYLAPIWFDITKDLANGMKLPYTIRIYTRDGFLPENSDSGSSDEGGGYYGSDGEEQTCTGKAGNSFVNKAARQLSQLSGYAHDWQGPLLACGIKEFTLDSHPKEGTDLRPGDLRHIRNFLTTLEDPMQIVRCVRVNCDGDLGIEGHAKFEPIMLPIHHAIFQQSATQISERIQFPIAAARIPGSVEMGEDKLMRDPHMSSPNVNQAVTFLYVCCDPATDDEEEFMRGGHSWGWAPLSWSCPVGSCIVARKDRKDLHPNHVAALSEYCQDHLGTFRQRQKESRYSRNPAQHISNDYVLDEITKDKFKKFWEAWKAKQTDPEKKGRISPYDV